MRTLYLDCFSGIAGDMFIGALLDTGLVSRDDFTAGLAQIDLEGYEVEIEKASRQGIAGTDIKVRSHEHHPHRHLSHILSIIEKSNLPTQVKERSAIAFRSLAEAEAEVHSSSPEEVHFHEVGAVDSIVDVIGSFLLMDMMNIDRVVSSNINVGSGTVKCDHGVMPVPAPATSKLLKGMPVYSDGDPLERTTPTGALLLKTLVDEFSSMPSGKIISTGYGLGDRDTELANVLRVTLIDEISEGIKPWESGKAVVIEANIDDMNPQDYEPAMEKLFEAGAWDVFMTPIIMKKQRPGVRLTCVAAVDLREKLAEVMLRHTTSIGVRFRVEDRMTLKRSIEKVETSLGSVRIKKSLWGDEVFQSTIEFEDLKELAKKNNISVGKARDIINLNRYPSESI